MPPENTNFPQPKFAIHGKSLQAVLVSAPLSQYQIKQPRKTTKVELWLQKFWKLCLKHKVKIGYVFLSLFTVALLIFLFFYYLPIANLIRSTNALATSNYSEADQISWAKTVASFPFFKMPTPLAGATEGEFSRSLLVYSNSYKDFNSNNKIQIPELEILNPKESQVDLGTSMISTDPKIPDSVSYNLPPRDYSFEKYMNCTIRIANIESPQLKFLLARVETKNTPLTVKGSGTNESLITQANSELTLLKTAISKNDVTTLESYLTGTDASQKQTLLTFDPGSSRLSSLVFFSNIKGTPDTSAVNGLIYLGDLETTQDTLTSLGKVKLYYDISASNYRFDGLAALIPQLKANVSPAQPAAAAVSTGDQSQVALTCTDCWLAPVDKNHALNSAYAPKVTNTGLNGGEQMLQEASFALKDLFAAAAKQGITVRIISAYRSYGEQVTTFNYWVQKQIQANSKLTKAQAEAQADLISARPGHSEHQLGTVADLKCASCGDFDNSAGNLKLYTFLEQHAYEYGFAISYANNTTKFTGYQYEPWHVRYIGKELAQEFFDTGYLSGNGNYLAKFLLDKNLY